MFEQLLVQFSAAVEESREQQCSTSSAECARSTHRRMCSRNPPNGLAGPPNGLAETAEWARKTQPPNVLAQVGRENINVSKPKFRREPIQPPNVLAETAEWARMRRAG